MSIKKHEENYIHIRKSIISTIIYSLIYYYLLLSVWYPFFKYIANMELGFWAIGLVLSISVSFLSLFFVPYFIYQRRKW